MNKKSTLLIVDDNPQNIKVLGIALGRQNYAISIAQNGLQALKALETTEVDLILLDIMMPEMDGFEVCKHVKENPETKDIPVIFLSAANSQDSELKGLGLGAIDYIHKPFSIPLVKARIEAHLELAQSKKQLLENKKELAEKNKALEQAARLRDDIERMTRHDLKTPLNAIIGFPQLLLLDDNLTDEQKQSLEEITRAGNVMLDMINNSLDLYKMETGCYTYKPEQVNVIELLKTIAHDLSVEASKKQLEIQFPDNKPDKPVLITVEKILTYSLFCNLLRNAIEASPEHNKIIIDTEVDNRQATVLITNQGAVPENIREHFFEKYVTSGKDKGTGLGTYSAKLMTEIQHGSISMQSLDNQTTLKVSLPCEN